MSNEKDDKKGKGLVFWLFVLALCGIGIWWGYSYINNGISSSERDVTFNQDTSKINKDTVPKVDSNFLKAVTTTAEEDSVHIIRVSDPSGLDINYQIDEKAGKPTKRIFTGRRINIAVIGVDSRLGAGTKHADANHILSILVDSGNIEITSIPRDTPADAGMADSSGQNKLTIVYAAKGRQAYFEEACRIAGLDKIHYYVEVSFSQAMGILELVGLKDPGSALQVLRSRTGLGGDDYQRSYNQGQFIGQMMFRHFEKFNGPFSELLLRGGLAITETNINVQTAKNIISQLKNKGFGKDKNKISNRVRPAMGMNFKIYDFTDTKTFKSLGKKIEYFNESQTATRNDSDSTASKPGRPNVAYRLRGVLSKSASDSAKYPQRVINNLKVYFAQHAWLQVTNQSEREKIRNDFYVLLYNAYLKKKDPKSAENVKRVIEDEKKLFESGVLKN
jgi:anionic cell wall polymer biosynthesis LytR-Cps2A-Psr (LCP) family protein